MAATVELQVNIAYEKAYQNLSNLETYLNALTKSPYTVRLEVQGIDKLNEVGKAALQLAKWSAQAEKAQAASNKALAQLATANAKATIATENRAKAEAQASDTATNLANANAKLVTAQNRVAVEHEKTAQTTNRLAIEQEKTARATQNAGTAASTAASGWSVLGGAMATALGHLASRAIQYALMQIRQALREAFDEMKNVDTELTNISKVSGKTGAELEAIGDRAYETASRYGVAASEYLSAVYDMQKAGMGDQAEDMGELAVKTMLVGDTTQDVASKFLLASNAAWKLNGDMGRLTQIVDEADYINNNYATTLDKLAAGMPIVASVAAQAGMSAEETMAALGTITTVTQESGTKAATALRALILNIEGQVGKFVTEEGEEFEVTEESVKSLQGLLEKYAKTEMDAAKAAGELINPMTAIQALFKGMAEDDLTDAELFTLLSSMGGKLRTNQLTALVQNYELFDEMLGRIADSAGTADSEIELMMGSWERKAQVLKNTWTELIADIVDTDFIKGSIDMLTEFVDSVDDVVNRLKDPFYDSTQTQKTYDALKAEYDTLIAKGNDLNSIEQARLKWLEKQLELLGLQAEAEKKAEAEKLQRQLTQAVPGTSMTADQAQLGAYTGSLNGIEFTGDLTAYQQALTNLNAGWSEYYNNLIRIRDADVKLTDAQQDFISSYEANQRVASGEVEIVRQTTDGYYALMDAYGRVITYAKDGTEAVEDQIDAIHRQGEEASENAEYWDSFKEGFVQPLEEAYEGVTGFFTEIFNNLNDYNASLEGLTTAQGEATAEAGNTATAASGIAPQIDTATASMNEFTTSARNAAGAVGSISMGSIGIGGGGHATGTKNAPGGPTLVNELGPELISENGKAYIANGGKPGVVNLSRGAIVLTAKETQEALRGSGGATKKINAAADGSHAYTMGAVIINGVQVALTAGSSTNTNITTPTGSQKKVTATINSNAKSYGSKKSSSGGSAGSAGGGGGGSGGSSSAKKKKSLDEYADELKDLLSNLDKQAKLADNQGNYKKEAQVWEKAQQAIKTMVDRYRKAGYKDDSDEILDLLNKNYDYANKQLKLYQDKWDELIDALESDADAQELANKLAEKQQAVDEAREALSNAQNQRTTRIYNAATGQWEWVADEKKITSAQKSLEKAEESYADEVKSQAIKELEAMRDTIVDLNDVVLGPALSAVALMAENSNEFQNFAKALNAVYGVGSYLSSTEGSTKVLETKDSHDTVYTFGDLVLTEEQAGTMTLKDLATRLSVLKLSS